MKIAVCEDDKKTLAFEENILCEMGIRDVEIDCFYSGVSLLRHMEKSDENRYQIYLLDIEMPDSNGLDVAKAIRKMDPRTLIIFVTAYSSYVFSSFEVQPFRFINKPIEKAEFKKTVWSAVNYIYTSRRYIFIVVDKALMQVSCDKILYFEGDRRKVVVHTVDGDYSFYSKMADVENMVDASWFVRTHVSFLVNLDYVRAIRLNELELNDGTVLPISKKYRNLLKMEHLKYIKWRIGI